MNFANALLFTLLVTQTIVFGEEESAEYGLEGAQRDMIAQAVEHFKREGGESSGWGNSGWGISGGGSYFWNSNGGNGLLSCAKRLLQKLLFGAFSFLQHFLEGGVLLTGGGAEQGGIVVQVVEELEGVPGQQEGVPGVQGGVPGEQGGVPGEQGGVPGEQGGVPGEQGGVPGVQGGVPGEQGGVPGEQRGVPGEQGGVPGEQGGVPGEQGIGEWGIIE